MDKQAIIDKMRRGETLTHEEQTQVEKLRTLVKSKGRICDISTIRRIDEHLDHVGISGQGIYQVGSS